MNKSLEFKAALVASPLEALAKHIRWALASRHRSAHPELAEVFLEEKHLPKVLERLLTKNSNVLDVGCHIGSFLSLASKFAPDGRHAAIEASPTKAGWISRKFPGVRVEQVAVSDQVGTAVFEENIAKPGFSRLQGRSPSTDPVNRYAVAVSTLDALNLGSFDLVKIDIEGAELAALKGGTDFILTNRPKIIFECGADANVGLDRRTLFDFLTDELGYDIFTFTDFLYGKGSLSFDEFRKCGIYPFRAFNFVAMPKPTYLASGS